jgi:ribonuclease J
VEKKVLLEDKNVRIFLDFGQSLAVSAEYFTGWLCSRTVNGLGDYFEFNLLPKIKGVYSKEQLAFAGIPYTKPKIDAVSISHAHVDHMGHILFLDEEIPAYCGSGTKLFIDSIKGTSSADFGEHPIETFRTGSRIEIGHLVVEPIYADHSIPASYGFIIHTSEGEIVYTGDLRAHGPGNEMTKEFAERACRYEHIAMISEGTRMVEMEKRKNYSELEMEKLSNEIVSETKTIVFVTHYGRDTDRFRTFYNVAKNNDRKIVVPPKTPHMLSSLAQDEHLPDSERQEHLSSLQEEKPWRFLETDYYGWEREFIDKMVNYKFVHEHQREAITDLDFYQFPELIDIKPDLGSHFIRSMSKPYSDEDIEDAVMHNWLNHFKVRFHQLHASGHMNRRQLTNLINYI